MSAQNSASPVASATDLPISLAASSASAPARSAKRAATFLVTSTRSSTVRSLHSTKVLAALAIAASTSLSVANGNVSATSPVAGSVTWYVGWVVVVWVMSSILSWWVRLGGLGTARRRDSSVTRVRQDRASEPSRRHGRDVGLRGSTFDQVGEDLAERRRVLESLAGVAARHDDRAHPVDHEPAVGRVGPAADELVDDALSQGRQRLQRAREDLVGQSRVGRAVVVTGQQLTEGLVEADLVAHAGRRHRVDPGRAVDRAVEEAGQGVVSGVRLRGPAHVHDLLEEGPQGHVETDARQQRGSAGTGAHHDGVGVQRAPVVQRDDGAGGRRPHGRHRRPDDELPAVVQQEVEAAGDEVRREQGARLGKPQRVAPVRREPGEDVAHVGGRDLRVRHALRRGRTGDLTQWVGPIAPEQAGGGVQRPAGPPFEPVHRVERPPSEPDRRGLGVGHPPQPGRTAGGGLRVAGAVAVDERHGVAAAGQLGGRGQPPRAGSDDDDPHGPTLPSRRQSVDYKIVDNRCRTP